MSSPHGTEHRLLSHLAAFALAWIAASAIFAYVLRAIAVPLPQPGYHINSLGKGEVATRNLLYISGALRGGETIVVLGSSELDKQFSNSAFRPDMFLPAHHLARVLTYGSPGFETLGMYGMLSALRPHLNPNTRLVLMLSPAWFHSTDMQPAIFNENFNDSILLQLYLSDDPRGVVHDYLTTHQADYRDMTFTQRLFLGDPSSIMDWNLPMFVASTINSRAYGQREKLALFLGQLDRPDLGGRFAEAHTADIPWGSIEDAARRNTLKRMTNNDVWVDNTFYTQVVKRHPAHFKEYFPGEMNPEPEMSSLKLLLQLLQRSKVKALVVMQPVNSRLFSDVGRFAPVDERISNLCREYNADYLDLYARPLEMGFLKDDNHPSDVGWLVIDRQIAEHFDL